MGDIEKTVQHMVDLANDDKHGYSQVNRYGPDYDCSSSISESLIVGGFNVSKFSPSIQRGSPN